MTLWRSRTVDGIEIVPVQRLDLRVVPRPWAFAEARREEIANFFAAEQRTRTGMWNGRVLLLGDFAVADDSFRGEFFETDFAAFYAWTQWGFPDPSVKNCFAAGALRTADGAFVLGVMGRQTANPGSVYFPCGTPDPDDVDGERVDFERSVRRELVEELGLGAADYDAAAEWSIVFAGPRIALIKPLWVRQAAAPLCARIEGYLADEAEPELAGVRLVRGVADFDATMPSFVTAYLRSIWSHVDENKDPA